MKEDNKYSEAECTRSLEKSSSTSDAETFFSTALGKNFSDYDNFYRKAKASLRDQGIYVQPTGGPMIFGYDEDAHYVVINTLNWGNSRRFAWTLIVQGPNFEKTDRYSKRTFEDIK